MRITRIVAALAFLSVAGAAHADWPFIQNNQIDDFTVPQRGVPAEVAAQPAPVAQPDRAALPDCCAGIRASVDAPAPVGGLDFLSGESAG